MRPPRRLQRWLLRCLPPSDRRSVTADLGEEYVQYQRPARGRIGGWFWYARQALLTLAHLRLRRRVGAGSAFDRGLIADGYYALRYWRSHWPLGLTCAGILALGLGSTAAMFAVLDTTLLRPLPFPDADRLVRIWTTRPHLQHQGSIGIGWNRYGVWRTEYEDFSARTTHFETVAGVGPRSRVVTLRDGATRVNGRIISSTFVPLLGVELLAGRNFTAAEDREHVPVVLVSERLAREVASRVEDAIGRTLPFDGQPFTIVGVVPRVEIDGIADGGPIEFWMPLGTYRDLQGTTNDPGVQLLARLERGTTAGQAHAETDMLLRSGEAPSRRGVRIVGLFADQIAAASRSIWLMSAAVAGLLLIAIVNAGGLLAAAVLGRDQEFAVRLSLGANPSRLVRQVALEACWLAIVTLGPAVWLGWALLPVLSATLPRGLPGAGDLALDGRTPYVLAVLALVVASMSAAIAWRRVRNRGQFTSTWSSRSITGDVRSREAAVAAQAAVATGLLCCASLLVVSLWRLHAVPLGFDPSGVIVAVITPGNEWNAARRTRLQRELLDGIGRQPGVEAAALSAGPPFAGGGSSGVRLPALGLTGEAERRVVSAAYFDVLRVPLISGRVFTSADSATSAGAIVISREFQRQYFGDRDPIGHQLEIVRGPYGRPPTGSLWTIVGVVGDTAHRSKDAPLRPTLYMPSDQQPGLAMTVSIRRSAEPAAVSAAVRETIRGLAPDLPVTRLTSLDTLVAESMAVSVGRTRLAAASALMALLLTASGLYAAMTALVAGRQREIALRMALGCSPRGIGAQIVRRGLTLLAAGLTVGLPAGMAGAHALRSFLFEVTIDSVLVYAGVAVIMLATGLLALAIPTRRARRIDPVAQLRA